ncbi:MAG TPA: hypothetical protein VI197_33500 [Polyangiaceae bacterium]
MEWEKPSISVIDMNAEVGSYQPDFDDVPVRGISAGPESSDTEPTPVSPAKSPAE